MVIRSITFSDILLYTLQKIVIILLTLFIKYYYDRFYNKIIKSVLYICTICTIVFIYLQTF